jgi:Fe(3+) dicitrate transport protein
VYAEQLINFGAGFSLSPGARLEYLLNSRSGQGGPGFFLLEESKNRMLPLLGLAGSWKSPFGMEVYANYSQAYRPVTFSELTPSANTETVDAGLKDSRGFNSELGLRGKIQSKGAVFPHLTYDVNAFYLDYRNKVGLLKNLKTNIGNAESRGIEAFLEFRPFPYTGTSGIWPDVSLFISGCYMKARYSDWKDTSAALNRSGKAVEYAPELTIRTGIQAQWKGWNFSAIWNQVDAVYTDAMNLESPSANAQLGKLPGWQTLDVSAGFGFLSHYQIKVGSNNLLDERYATRRSGGYPGPGLLPGQARNIYASVSVRF